MAGYEKQTWVDDETVGTADRFNHMEEGIVLASKTGGVEVGTIVYIEDNAKVPEGWNVVEGDNALPIGSGMDYYGATAPKGYMFADGSAISRTEYAELFKIFGTTYGAGDGSTTFNLPDKRSRVSVTKDSGTFNTLGKKGGEETHKLTVSEMPSHNHNFYADLARSTHVNIGQMYNGAAQQFIMVGQNFDNLNNSATSNDASFIYAKDLENNGKATISNTGGEQAHNNLQPYLVCNYIIKVKSLKAIMKVSVTPIDPITGSIVDTTNIDDKTTNTYSANTIDGLIKENVTNSTGWIQLYEEDDEGNKTEVGSYRKTGKIVEVKIAIWSDSADYNIPAYTQKILATLPEDCKPSVSITINPLIVPADRTQTYVVHVRVNTDGTISLQNWYTEINCLYVTTFISYVV